MQRLASKDDVQETLTFTAVDRTRIAAGAPPAMATSAAAKLILSVCDSSASRPYGDRLEHGFTVRAGEMAFQPAWQHLPINASERAAVACIVARTDPDEQESVVLLSELEGLRNPRARRWGHRARKRAPLKTPKRGGPNFAGGLDRRNVTGSGLA